MIHLIACKSGKNLILHSSWQKETSFSLLQIPSLTFPQFLTRLGYVFCFYLLLYSWKYWKRSCLTYFKGMFKLKIMYWFKTLTFGKIVLVNEVKTIFIKHCFTKKKCIWLFRLLKAQILFLRTFFLFSDLKTTWCQKHITTQC